METRSPAKRQAARQTPNAAVDIDVADDRWLAAIDPGRLSELALAAAGGAKGEITISLSGDTEVRDLNKQYRGLDKPTNVLSFPAARRGSTALAHPLGDIIIAYETAGREALELGIALADHAAHLVVHGVLHLLGHDHGSDSEAEAMQEEERRILAAFGIADPYLRLDAQADEPLHG